MNTPATHTPHMPHTHTHHTRTHTHTTHTRTPHAHHTHAQHTHAHHTHAHTPGSTAGSDKVAKKIVELSKKNRELAAEVARHRSKAKELQETVNKFEVSHD